MTVFSPAGCASLTAAFDNRTLHPLAVTHTAKWRSPVCTKEAGLPNRLTPVDRSRSFPPIFILLSCLLLVKVKKWLRWQIDTWGCVSVPSKLRNQTRNTTYIVGNKHVCCSLWSMPETPTWLPRRGIWNKAVLYIDAPVCLVLSDVCYPSIILPALYLGRDVVVCWCLSTLHAGRHLFGLYWLSWPFDFASIHYLTHLVPSV